MKKNSNIINEMRLDFEEQIKKELAEIRISAENEVKDQIAHFKLSVQEAIKNCFLKAEQVSFALEKISSFDEYLAQIEKRFADLHISREWLTRAEIKFKEINKDVMFHLNLLKSLMKKKPKKRSVLSKRAPNQMERDSVLLLKKNNWTIEEICNGLNMTRGEVELLLELASKE